MTYTTEEKRTAAEIRHKSKIYPTIVFEDATDIIADMEAILKSNKQTRIMAETVIDKMNEHVI